MPSEFEAIRAASQETLVNFLKSDLDLASTFIRTAHNACDAARYFAAKKNAINAADSVRRFMGTVVDGLTRAEIGTRLAELDRSIAALDPPSTNI
jgi:hypothetical protein